MDAPQPLYNLAPLLQMLLLGALIALGPLLWVAAQSWSSRWAQAAGADGVNALPHL